MRGILRDYTPDHLDKYWLDGATVSNKEKIYSKEDIVRSTRRLVANIRNGPKVAKFLVG